jgi:hypothetical protein
MTTTLVQKGKRVGAAGSFINQMMSNNDTVPTVGEYCTFLSYTDRSVGIIREWNPDTLTVKIETCNTRADRSAVVGELPMGHQNWIHEPSGYFTVLTFRKDGWYAIGTENVYTKEFLATLPAGMYAGMWMRKHNMDLHRQVYPEGCVHPVLVEGVTRAKKTYSKYNVIFNVCDYYYDWSF